MGLLLQPPPCNHLSSLCIYSSDSTLTGSGKEVLGNKHVPHPHMDTAAPKLDLEGSMGLGLVHSGLSRPPVLPDSGTETRHNMFRVVGDTDPTGDPLEKASHSSSAGQQAEDSFICSLTRSDRLVCEGFSGPLSLWLPG